MGARGRACWARRVWLTRRPHEASERLPKRLRHGSVFRLTQVGGGGVLSQPTGQGGGLKLGVDAVDLKRGRKERRRV
jgi:hypothetical protein